MPTIFVRHIPEYVIPGMRLGRHVRYDSRNAFYPYWAPQRAVQAQVWARHTPILDQGNLGSCTGNAITGALGCDPLLAALPATHPVLDETEAVHLYSRATQLDNYPGAYPPNDTGSDGVSAAKAAQKDGLISGYTHCTDIATMEQALQAGPVIIGINWYDSFDAPDSSGYVSISKGASVRGGHEVVVRGIDPVAQRFAADNSWGASWGVKGSFQFSYATMERLLSEQGDCTVPMPLTVAPPPPPPADPDATFAAVLLAQNAAGKAWVDQRHYGYVEKVANAGRAWLDAKNLG